MQAFTFYRGACGPRVYKLGAYMNVGVKCISNGYVINRSISLTGLRKLFRDEPRLLPSHELCHGSHPG